jgi:hypothetical protein
MIWQSSASEAPTTVYVSARDLTMAASQQLASREESHLFPVFDKPPRTRAVDKQSLLFIKSQSIAKRHAELSAISPRNKTPTFRNNVREHRSQGYVSQKTYRCIPVIGPASCLFLLPSITHNTMRPLVQFAVRAARSGRALPAFKPTPNRFFHTSPRSLCPESQDENDDDFRIATTQHRQSTEPQY